MIKIAPVFLCVGLSLSSPVSAQNYQYGMNAQSNLDAVSASVTDKMVELGAGILRMPFGWDVIEPTCKGCFDWKVTDAWRDQARRTRRVIFATLGFTPRWANGGRPYSYPPLKYEDWYDFVYAVVTRYKDDIFFWGIWNEPNLDSYLHDADMQVYQALVTTASAAIRAANPLARVLGPEVSHHAFQDGWYAAAMTSFGEAFDIVTVHWFPNGPNLEFTMDELVWPFALRKSVWLTEVGMSGCDRFSGKPNRLCSIGGS